MKMTIDMPVVAECAISDCAYNLNQGCHARAITIGDGVHPGCDTFLSASGHTRERVRTAGVGACKVAACQHNDDFECMANEINVGLSGNDINCLTFRER